MAEERLLGDRQHVNNVQNTYFESGGIIQPVERGSFEELKMRVYELFTFDYNPYWAFLFVVVVYIVITMTGLGSHVEKSL